jgi:hypothetical protein
MSHPEELQELLRLMFRSGFPVKGERQHHVFPDRQGGDQIEVLEYISERLPPDLRELPFGEGFCLPEDRSGSEVELPGSWIVETAQEVDQSGLAGPGGTDDRDEVTFVDAKGNAIYRSYFLVAARVDLGPAVGCYNDAILSH